MRVALDCFEHKQFDVFHIRFGFDAIGRGTGGLSFRASSSTTSCAGAGSARALHQCRPISDPPTEHLHDIVGNAGIFHRR